MAGRLSLEEGMAALVGVERACPVADWRVAGTQIWPLVRVRIGYGIAAAAFDLPYPTNDRVGGAARRVAKKALAALPNLRDLSLAGPSSRYDVLFLSNGISVARFEDVVFDRLCDPIREELSAASYSSLLLVPAPAKGPFCEPAVQVQLRADMAKVRGLAMVPTVSISLPGYDDVVQELGRVGLAKFVPSPRLLRAATVTLLSMSRLFQRWLARTEAKLGFVGTYYRLESMAFVHACHASGVPSVDIQHGIQGWHHAAYAQWSAVPDDGFELVPRYFWVWSNRDAEQIDAWRPSANHEPIVGGNPFLRLVSRGSGPRAASVEEAAAGLRAAEPPGRTVLVTLNGFESTDDLEELAGVVAGAPPTWRWWIRAHPRNPGGGRDAITVLVRNGVAPSAVDDASHPALFALLSRVDAHVTRFSSVVIEAAAFGVPSIVTAPEGLSLYATEREAGLVEFAEPAQLVSVADRLAARGARRTPDADDGGVTWATALLARGGSVR